MKRHPSGFTLIELLVVIAVLALLMAIPLPGPPEGPVRPLKGRSVPATAARPESPLHMYAQDYDNAMIPLSNPSGDVMSAESLEPWMAVLCYAPNARIGETLKATPPGHSVRTGAHSGPGGVSTARLSPVSPSTRFPTIMSSTPDTVTTSGAASLPTIPGVEGHVYVRTSYNYWTHGKRRMHELSPTGHPGR